MRKVLREKDPAALAALDEIDMLQKVQDVGPVLMGGETGSPPAKKRRRRKRKAKDEV